MSQRQHFELVFDIKSEWHLGAGREGGAYADSLVYKDANGLPLLTGKSIKGLVRQAFCEALKYNWLGKLEGDQDQASIINFLFGSEGGELDKQGLLQFSSATLSPAEQAYFIENKQAIQHLYRVRHATAIEQNTGVAKEGSLRTMEVVVPMKLIAPLTFIATAKQSKHYQDWLKKVLPLICALGGKRRRGLGEVLVTLAQQKECL